MPGQALEPPSPIMNRNQTITSIKENPQTTVLIIGAGINGIGTFRDLALQGVDCLLVDREDFCSGASMASSHMLHGGIRYLENGEFRLVREALHERNNLLRNAPHLTKPLPTTIPIYKRFSGILNAPLKFMGLLDKPAERGAIIIKLGLMLYDAYVRGDSPMLSHQFNNRQETLNIWPTLNPKVLYTATYFDGAVDYPERLALEILLDGLNEGEHARALNYCPAVGAEEDQIILQDETNGGYFKVKPDIIVNAGGPWIDLINKEISQETRYIGGTKGSHLILNHPPLRKALRDHEIFFEYHDGRIVLIFPFLEDLVLIGSTDLRIEDPNTASCTDEETDYILGMVPYIFPDIRVTREHIQFHFSGVRPLPRAKGFTGGISRDHSTEVIEKGPEVPWPILSLVGGKWTSYRAFSEQVADHVLSQLNLPRKEKTTQLGIGGGKDYPREEKKKESWISSLAAKSGFSHDRTLQLFERYGTRAQELVAYLSESDDHPLIHLPGYSKEEVIYLTEKEMIIHLDDFFLRRTKLAWTGQVSIDSIQEVGEIIAEVIDWDQGTRQEEITRLIGILRNQHGVKI